MCSQLFNNVFVIILKFTHNYSIMYSWLCNNCQSVVQDRFRCHRSPPSAQVSHSPHQHSVIIDNNYYTIVKSPHCSGLIQGWGCGFSLATLFQTIWNSPFELRPTLAMYISASTWNPSKDSQRPSDVQRRWCTAAFQNPRTHNHNMFQTLYAR